jgi:hypothetical protein
VTYSYTQISQYLACPRRYKHRYLDGWKEKDTRAAMLFGRAFENALAAYFRREDAAAELFREWSAHQHSGLTYSNGVTWDRMLQQGIQLLERFAQEDRVRIRQPRRNLQIKFTKSVSPANDFVAYVDAIGLLDGSKCLLEWKTTSSRYPEQPEGLLNLDPGRIRSQTNGRNSILSHHNYGRAARGIRPAGRGHRGKDRIRPIPAAQWSPVPAEPVHQLLLHRLMPGEKRNC